MVNVAGAPCSGRSRTAVLLPPTPEAVPRAIPWITGQTPSGCPGSMLSSEASYAPAEVMPSKTSPLV